MKALIVVPYFYPRVGGVEVYALNMARQLKVLGWQVAIITTGGRESGRQAGADDLKIYRLLPVLTVSNTPIGLSWRKKLRQIYEKENPDLVNAHMPVPYLADMAQRACKSIPFILTYHNDLVKDALPHRAVVGVLHRTLIERTLRRSTHIITTSEYYAQASPYLKPHLAKLSIVPPGVDRSRFNPGIGIPSDLAEKYAGRRIILFVASLNKSHRHKGLDVLLAAFSLIHRTRPEATLVVVGAGDAMESYRSMASASGVGHTVEFTGYLDDDRLAQYYKLATVLAVPSTNRSEGFGMVFIEAGSTGTPVVGSRIGGIPYAVLDDETGLLVTPRSVEATADALRRVLDDQGLAERLGAAGSARAQTEFDWAKLAAKTSDIFTGVCGLP